MAGVALAREISPILIRVHGCFYNGYLAAQIKKSLNLPLVVSLHTCPIVNLKDKIPLLSKLKKHLTSAISFKFARETLETADLVLPVYSSICKYVQQFEVNHLEVCYNVINPDNLSPKKDYSLNRPPRIISVSRQPIKTTTPIV